MKFKIDAGNRCSSHPAQAQLTPDHRSSKSSRVVAEKLDTANPRLLSRPCRWFGLPPCLSPLPSAQRSGSDFGSEQLATDSSPPRTSISQERPPTGPAVAPSRSNPSDMRSAGPPDHGHGSNLETLQRVPRLAGYVTSLFRHPGHQLLGHRSLCRNTSTGYLLGEEPHRDRRFVSALGSSVYAPRFFLRPRSCQ